MICAHTARRSCSAAVPSSDGNILLLTIFFFMFSSTACGSAELCQQTQRLSHYHVMASLRTDDACTNLSAARPSKNSYNSFLGKFRGYG